MNRNYNPRESELALREWSGVMRAALDQRYGRNKVGHLIVLFPYGPSQPISWISSATVESVINITKGLSEHLAKEKSAIVTPTPGEVGHFG